MRQQAAGKGSGRLRAWVTLGLLVALSLHICGLSIALGGNGDELPHRHAEGAPNEACQPRQHQRPQPLTASPDTCGVAAGWLQSARVVPHRVRAPQVARVHAASAVLCSAACDGGRAQHR